MSILSQNEALVRGRRSRSLDRAFGAVIARNWRRYFAWDRLALLRSLARKS